MELFCAPSEFPVMNDYLTVLTCYMSSAWLPHHGDISPGVHVHLNTATCYQQCMVISPW